MRNHPSDVTEWTPIVDGMFSPRDLRTVAIAVIAAVDKSLDDDQAETRTASGLIVPGRRTPATAAEVRHRYKLAFTAAAVMRGDLHWSATAVADHMYLALRMELAGEKGWPDMIRKRGSYVTESLDDLATAAAAR